MDKSFFEFISGFCEKLDMNIVFSSKEGIVTIVIFFKPKDDTYIPELVISGPPETLEEQFYNALLNPMHKVSELTSNIDFFNTQIARTKAEKEKKAIGKKTTVQKTAKSVTEATTVSTETTTAPIGSTGDMFSKEKVAKPKENVKKPVETPKAIILEEKRTAADVGTEVHKKIEEKINDIDDF